MLATKTIIECEDRKRSKVNAEGGGETEIAVSGESDNIKSN